MLKNKLVYAVVLAISLALFFVIGNPTHPGTLSVHPWLLAMVPFPVVLTIQLRSALKRNSGLSLGHVFRLGESTVSFAALLFGAFTFAYAYFYFRPRDSWFLGTGLLLTILSTWLVGTVFSLPCALVLTRVAKRHQV